jgi:iron complex outermembrane receptor protein
MLNSERSRGTAVLKHRIAIVLAAAAMFANAQAAEETEESNDVAELSDVQVTEDPLRALSNEPSASSFGFTKPLLETPRSVSFISEEQINLFALNSVEDLVRVVPGAFTTTRFGIQGGIDVRNVPADTYFRGMKRINLQGHSRTVLAAMDSIEVVKGPPSPVFGMGKIGGYTNVTPKSGRAKIGGYLPDAQGFAQAIAGSYDRAEWSFGVGGPLGMKEKQGGYYVYGLLEDSESFTRDVPYQQKIVQAAVSVDNFIGPFRLDVGANYQFSKTAGALTSRVTQDLIDDGTYIRGTPLANLDANGNGSLGYLEYNQGSPVRGNLSAANQPLSQRWNWQRDANGNPLPLDQFQKVPGIPESLYNYLVTSCGGSATAAPTGCADPTGLLRAQGIGGPRPTSGYTPIGFALDPRTVGYDTLDLRRAGAFERELEGTFLLGFADLVYDVNPDFTIKNQLFYDSMDQFKVSQQPSGGKQDVSVIEDKITVTRRVNGLPEWLKLNSLGSVNFRSTKSSGYRYGGDFGSTRTDVMAGTGGMTPNTSFIHAFENSDILNDGAPWTSDYETKYWESGLGLLFDLDIFTKTNVLIGGRYDYSKAKNTDFATFNPAVGTATNPGRPVGEASAEGSDHGTSWSVSLSHQLPWGFRPYATFAKSSLSLDSNNNSLDNATIESGHIGSAELKEVGIKAQFFGGKLQFSTAGYRQTRTDISRSDDPTIGAEVSSTETEGWETEIKWVPIKNAYVSLYGLTQKSVYLFNNGGNILVDARTLGFQDVVDPVTGAVIYPAEAFLYGGRAFLTLPAGVPQYTEKQGNPNTQLGLTGAYQLENGLGFTLSANRLSAIHSGRLQLIELPETTTLNVGLTYDIANWDFKLDVFNATNERYFRARTGDTLSDALVSAMADRRWQLTVRTNF